jgi:regulator of cell morphogenesis and NO signaling
MANPLELSERELVLLPLFVKGMFDREIAEHLSISTLTVRTHRANILKKLGDRPSGTG